MLSAVKNKLEGHFAVNSVMEFAAIEKSPPIRSETLYVIPLGERVKNTEYTGVIVSTVIHQFGVVTALRNAKNVDQQALDEIRNNIRELLAGWIPLSGYEPITRGNGSLLQLKNKTVYWLDVFETQSTEQAQHHQ